MKILFINTNIGYGGASKMIASIAESFALKQHDVTFLTFRHDEVLQPLDPKVKLIHNKLCKKPSRDFINVKKIFNLHKYLKREKFDLAIAFLHPSHYMLTLAAKGTKTKVLLSERGDPYSRLKNGGMFVHFIERIIHMADAYVFQSEGAKSAYPLRCQEKSEVIVNSIPDVNLPQRFIGKREKVIVSVARFELVQKRQDVLLKAFKLFLESHPDFILRLYGDGPDENKIRSYVDELGITDNVEFMGATKNVPEKIKNAAMFVLTSDYEGLPNALLEAMATGVPCISTDCSPGGARMIIDDGNNGFIVPCGDVNALADKMLILSENFELSEVFSQKAVTIIDRFSKDTVSDRWLNFISKVVGDK